MHLKCAEFFVLESALLSHSFDYNLIKYHATTTVLEAEH